LPITSFSYIYILQGSVATQLWYGEIFNNQFITNFPVSVLVKEFWKSVNISKRYRKNKCDVFFGTQCSKPESGKLLFLMFKTPRPAKHNQPPAINKIRHIHNSNRAVSVLVCVW